MQQYSSNAIHTLTNEQRKALAQCLILGVRPSEILLHTKYVLVAPTGELEFAITEANRDWLKLLQEDLTVDALTGAIVGQPTVASSQQEDTVQYDGPSVWNLPTGWSPVHGQMSGRTIVASKVTPAQIFTPDQERRIRELIDEAFVNVFKQARLAILREAADSAEEAE